MLRLWLLSYGQLVVLAFLMDTLVVSHQETIPDDDGAEQEVTDIELEDVPPTGLGPVTFSTQPGEPNYLKPWKRRMHLKMLEAESMVKQEVENMVKQKESPGHGLDEREQPMPAVAECWDSSEPPCHHSGPTDAPDSCVDDKKQSMPCVEPASKHGLVDQSLPPEARDETGAQVDPTFFSKLISAFSGHYEQMVQEDQVWGGVHECAQGHPLGAQTPEAMVAPQQQYSPIGAHNDANGFQGEKQLFASIPTPDQNSGENQLFAFSSGSGCVQETGYPSSSTGVSIGDPSSGVSGGQDLWADYTPNHAWEQTYTSDACTNHATENASSSSSTPARKPWYLPDNPANNGHLYAVFGSRRAYERAVRNKDRKRAGKKQQFTPY